MAVESQLYSETQETPVNGSGTGMNDVGHFDGNAPQENLQQMNLLRQNQGFQFFLGTNCREGGCSVSGCFADLLEKQRQDIDLVLQLQNERLRTILMKESRQLHDIILQRSHSKITHFIRQKDEDLAIATRKTMELDGYLRSMEIENKKWQRKAKENEAKAAELYKALTRVREQAVEAESVCDFPTNWGNRGESRRNRGQEREGSKSMYCKLCFSKRCCVVFLPCRHLCSCESCEGFVGFCPVCKSAKEASMEVYLV